jgi:hypothetical protein
MHPILLSAGQRAGATSLSVARADAAAWGNALEAAARSIAAAAALAYCLGESLGSWVHAANDQLAAAYRCLLVGAHRAEAAAEQVAEQVVATWQELPLTSFRVVELRTRARELGIRTAGGRGIAQARRDDLLLALGAA